MSSDLIWQVIRNNNSFLVKRDGVQLSAEKNNLTNKHSFKYSGLANTKTVGVNLSKDKKITLAIKRTKTNAARHPATGYTVYALNKHQQNHTNKAAKTIRQLTTGSYYRPDLANAAVGRYHALHRSLKPVINKKSKRKPRGSKAK